MQTKKNKQVTLKFFAPFTDCISEKNNTPVDNAKDLDVVMLMYNLIVYCNNYTKTSGSSWQYHKDIPNDNITISEVKITGRTPTDSDRKDIEIAVSLKYLSKIWRTHEMSLINYEVNPIITWSVNCVISNSTSSGTFETTDTKLYVSVVTASTQNNTKLPQQLKTGFKQTINWNKYPSKPTEQGQNP